MSAVKHHCQQIDAKTLQQQCQSSTPPLVIDVRESHEWDSGILPEACLVSNPELAKKIHQLTTDFKRQIVVYCASGKRSESAAATLYALGYQNVSSLSGGISSWHSLGLPIISQFEISHQDRQRYARHLSLKSVGVGGQKKLWNARVLIVGVGGLGCPAALYLAAAGVGHLGLMDFDTVDLSNLQRQVLFRENDLGQPKANAAKRHLQTLNSGIHIEAIANKLDHTNAETVLQSYDLVINGCDNFASRYLVNDACYFLKKPLVDGSVSQFEGRVTVFEAHKQGPCYRCLYPSPPPPEMAPNCATAGVLGVLPGIIGTLQATEAIKYCLGLGETLTSRIWLYDALSQNVRILKTNKNKHCALCGENANIVQIHESAASCRL